MEAFGFAVLFSNAFIRTNQLLHAKWLFQVVIATKVKTFHHVFGQRFGRKKNNGNAIVELADIFGKCVPVLNGHHDIQNADCRIKGRDSGRPGYSVYDLRGRMAVLKLTFIL